MEWPAKTPGSARRPFFEDRHAGGMCRRVADAKVDEVAASFPEQIEPLAVHHHVRLAGVVLGHLHVVPAELGADAGAECLGDCLLGGEPRGQKRRGILVPQAVLNLGGEQNALSEPLAEFLVRGADALDLYDVDAGAENHSVCV